MSKLKTVSIVSAFSLVSLWIADLLYGIMANSTTHQLSWAVAGFFLAGLSGLIWIANSVSKAVKELRETAI